MGLIGLDPSPNLTENYRSQLTPFSRKWSILEASNSVVYSNSNIQTKFYRLFLLEVELFDIHKKTGPDGTIRTNQNSLGVITATKSRDLWIPTPPKWPHVDLWNLGIWKMSLKFPLVGWWINRGGWRKKVYPFKQEEEGLAPGPKLFSP